MPVASTFRGTIRRHPRGTAMVALLIAGGMALYWFAPWNLFVDRRVDEALPGASAEVPATTGSTVTGPGDPAARPAEQGSDGPVTLAKGSFTSLEHTTTGTALVLELEDGTRYLRLQDLETAVIWCRRFSVGFAVAPLGSSRS